MIKRILQTIVLVLSSNFVFGQEERIHIQVVGNEEQIPLMNVSVVNLSNGLLLGTTNEKGIFTTSPFSEETQLVLLAFGFESDTIRVYKSSMMVSLFVKENRLDQIVVTGVSEPVKRRDALSVYNVISSKTIKQIEAVTLDQALAYQPTVQLGTDAILGSNIRMQGLGGDKVKILLDGMPLNGREGGNIDLSQVNLYNAERIEVVQGPMSVIYGTDALGGVINIISKPTKLKHHFGLQTQYESVGKYNVNMNLGWRLSPRSALNLNLGRNFFEGYKYLDTGSLKRRQLFKPREQYPASLNFKYTAASGFSVKYFGDFLKEKIISKGTPTITPYEAFALDDYYRTTRAANRILLGGRWKQLKWQMNNSFMYYQRKRNLKVKDLVSLQEQLSSDKGVQDTSVFTDVASRGNIYQKKNRFSYTLGYDLNLQWAKSQKIENGSDEIQDYAVFGSAQYELIPKKWILETGWRAAYNSKYSIPLIPSVSMMAKPDNHVQLRASYARGYRAPSLKEMHLYFVDPQHNIIGNPDLMPEDGHHTQLSAAWQLFEKADRFVQLSFFQYYNKVRNSISLIPVNPLDSTSIDYTYGNLAEYENAISNVQIEAGRKNMYASLAWNWTYVFADQTTPTDLDFYNLTASVNYRWAKADLQFSTFYRYNAEQPFLRSSVDGEATFEGTQQAYHNWDFSVSKSFLDKHWQITLGLKNIFDVQTINTIGVGQGGAHSGGGQINQLPRSFFVNLGYKWNED